ncbi:invasin [Gibbsiella quercinecans]|nr:invasin [Gibbsiella quercinecans]
MAVIQVLYIRVRKQRCVSPLRWVWLAGGLLSAVFSPPALAIAAPLDAQALPDLGSSAVSNTESEREKNWAEVAKGLGESSMNQSSGQQARTNAANYMLGKASTVLQQQARDFLSPLGSTSVSLVMADDGGFAGSRGQLFTPLHENGNLLTYSQLGFWQKTDSSLANLALGQRWMSGDWMLGYNTVLDRDITYQRNRGSLGAEAWGDYLRFSANYYYPLSSFKPQTTGAALLSRPARGYDMTTQGYLPFYRQIGASFRYEQYLGDNIDLFGSGNRYSDPRAVKFSLNYTPVPLVTVKANHQLGEGGETQDSVELSLNYRLGVPLEKQLQSQYVADAKSLRGGRYDSIERNNDPVLAFQQRKTLQVFLATPPWSLREGETLPLVLEIKSKNPIARVSWQGDTQVLSLTPPQNNNDPHGWSVIMPKWDTTEGAENRYRLSVTLEDDKQQRVTSNWITLQVTAPLSLSSGEEPVPTLPASS